MSGDAHVPQMRAVLPQLRRSEAEVRFEIPGPTKEVDRGEELCEGIRERNTAERSLADAIGRPERGDERIDAHGDDKEDARPLEVLLLLLLSTGSREFADLRFPVHLRVEREGQARGQTARL